YITADASGPKHLVKKINRAKLEQLTGDLIEKSMKPVKQALEDAGLSPSDINEVVMVGGMTRMPAVQEAVSEFFGKTPHRGVNPDEVVAVGAAIQAGVLGGEVDDLLLLDVTPLTLSVETLGGVATPLIERNTTIPARESQTFSTASDNQSQVEIHVLQGERAMAVDNKSLGRFILDGIPPAPRGIPQVEVTFDINANGILEVTAKDKATGKTQNITITASSGLSDEEVEQMRKDAERHAEEDKANKEQIESRNNADTLAYTADKTLRDLGDKVPEDIKTEVESKVAEVRTELEKETIDAARLRELTDSLSSSLQKVGEAAYQSASEAGEGMPEADSGKGTDEGGDEGDVVEGEFEDV
ncbi:MAG: Hsp70 family protein, partial [Anaerolineales bacterium]|nr:Hsp70 family protein [Anaerolineales bacterium]